MAVIIMTEKEKQIKKLLRYVNLQIIKLILVIIIMILFIKLII